MKHKRANIESLKAAIERRQIVAPFDGKAGIVKVMLVSTFQTVLKLCVWKDRSSMKVVCDCSKPIR